MKIAGCILQKRFIEQHTEDDFHAVYKKKRIAITTNHGFGQSKFFYLKRFNIDVVDIKTGLHDVQSYEDLSDINEAIQYALEGACLSRKNSRDDNN